MSILSNRIYDSKNGLTYTRHGDYYFPELQLPAADKTPLGHYGRMRMFIFRSIVPACAPA